MQGGKDKKKQANLDKKETEVAAKVAGKAQETVLKEFEYENETNQGDKKDIRGKWPDAYNPKVIEQNWYEWWTKNGFFSPDNQPNIDAQSPAFTILIPPPNVTGTLHIGHALTNAVQDSLVRYYRQSGYRTEWLAGTDHAGISCQVVVEKQLAKQNIKRQDLGREKFIEKAWEWKADYGGRICTQLRRLGSSLDWNREVFTLDKKCTTAHDEAFVRLFDSGLIYRDNRLVSWDCTLQTAISDVEVEYMEVKTPIQLQLGGQKYPFGYLWNFSYPVVPQELEQKTNEELSQLFTEQKQTFVDYLTFGTTRPETMIGDSAIAIHPEDERYKKFHGRSIFHPLRLIKIPIICDDVLVDMNFGTGVVKITPAHDPNDFEAGRRHGLEFINILTEDGRCIIKQNTQLHMKPRFDARIEIIRIMTALNLYVGKDANPMSIGMSQRSRDVVEPMMRPQWYIDCRDMARRALEAVDTQQLLIIPKIHELTWRNYLSNIRPWCVSRQLWWGHQIPLYKVWIKDTEEPSGAFREDWVVGRNDDEAIQNGCAKLNCQPEKLQFKRDVDVTDTWFSSGLFPFASFGWPEQTPDFQKFFPGAVLETGYDILFFWVARMTMLSLQLHDKLPFREIYMHAMVRDSKGEKMSKSKGNVIDPLDCIEGATLLQLGEKLQQTNLSAKEVEEAKKLQAKEFPAGIAQCGTDALRLALCVYISQPRNINLDLNKIIAQRNFCNKIFNAVKFALNYCQIDQTFVDSSNYKSPEEFLQSFLDNIQKSSLINRFIINKLVNLVQNFSKSMRSFNVSQAAENCITFWWDQLCDVYIELVKQILVDKKCDAQMQMQTGMTLFTCLDQAIRMISIFMPFLCEEMFQHLPRWPVEKQLETVMYSKMPRNCKVFDFGNQQEIDQYDQVLVDQNSIYTQLLNNSQLASSSQQIEQIMQLINAARSLKTQYKMQSVKPIFFIQEKQYLINQEQLNVFCTLTNAESVKLVSKQETPKMCGQTVIDEQFSMFIELKGHIDATKEIQKLDAEIENINAQKQKLQLLMDSETYNRLPEQLRQQNVVKMAGFSEKLQKCEELKKNYQEMQ